MSKTKHDLPSLLTMQIAVRDSQAVPFGAPSCLMQQLLMCCNLDEHGWRCFPSYQWLMGATNAQSELTLQRAAKKLETLGLVQIKRRHNRSNIWVIPYKSIQEMAEAKKLELKKARMAAFLAEDLEATDEQTAVLDDMGDTESRWS